MSLWGLVGRMLPWHSSGTLSHRLAVVKGQMSKEREYLSKWSMSLRSQWLGVQALESEDQNPFPGPSFRRQMMVMLDTHFATESSS